MSKAQRFSLVLRGLRGAEARTKYLNFLQGLATQGEGIGTKGNRPESVALYLDPFNLPLGTEIKVQGSALQPSWDLFKGFSEVSQRVSESVGTDTPIKLSTYRPARIIRRQQNGSTGTKRDSKLTGLPYLKYNVESTSIPFGKKGPTDNMVRAFTEIKTQINPARNVRLSLVEEKI